MVDVHEKVSSYVIFGALVSTFIFRDGASGHFGFGPLTENASLFRGTGGLNLFLNDQQKSNQSSNLSSQRMVTKLQI